MQTSEALSKQIFLWVLLSGMFVATMDIAIINVAAPSIRADLDASASELQFIVTSYVLTYAMLLITSARLGHMLGYMRVFVLGVTLFTGSSLVCGLAPDPLALIAGRAVQGIGASLMVAQVLSGIQTYFSGPERTSAIGS